MHQPTLDVARRTLVIELQEHGIGNEQGIFRTPGLGRYAENEVLERPGIETVKTRVYAGDVGIKDFSLVGGHLCNNPARPAAEPV